MEHSPHPIFYSFRRCPYAMRARLALAVSQQTCELREVVLRDKAEEFIATSPTATVPTLKTIEGKVIDESLDIMLWALSINDPEKWLAPAEGSKAEMMELISACDGGFKASLDRYKYPMRYEGIDRLAERNKANLFLLQLNARLENSHYLCGGQVSLADMAIAPFIRQFANVDRQWFESEDWLHLTRWLNDFLNSKRFLGTMGKLSKWKAGDAPTLFPMPKTTELSLSTNT